MVVAFVAQFERWVDLFAAINGLGRLVSEYLIFNNLIFTQVENKQTQKQKSEWKVVYFVMISKYLSGDEALDGKSQ